MRPLAHRAALSAALLLLPAAPAISTAKPPLPETERRYLSGVDADSPTLWRFRVSEGLRADTWAEIPVPSHWEQHGFGRYAYGHDEHESDEVGTYRTTFSIPESWRGRRVRLRFEGAMTDTTPTVNGTRLATHQGGFTPFSYDVTRLLRFEDAGARDNELVVRVAERSANATVNAAEREADYWVFGGIYRPVYLEAVPRASIEDVAIDARHDGTFTVSISTRNAPDGSRLRVRVLDRQGRALPPDDAAKLEGPVVPGARARLQASFAETRPWSAEAPHVYSLEAVLEGSGGEPLHVVSERFGFRTVEVLLDRERESGAPAVQPGLYVNGQRVLLRGVNRHSFWPDTGRAGSRRRNLKDVERLRALHFNAVRASHYPPDRDFLDACDELGLYVIDELPGWHDAYDESAGAAILREMLRRDRNHPSVIVWANGNEGGWNRRLDGEFAAHDPQRRPVIHPDADFGGFDTGHYPSFEELRARLAEPAPKGIGSLVMPTELLHGLYDGGGGAGLGAYWEAMRTARRGAGGFLWSFADEAITRSDRDGALDHHGNYAPDGILGPWREETGSSAAVRAVLAPVRLLEVEQGSAGRQSSNLVLTPADRMTGRRRLRLLVENRTDPLALEAVWFSWRRVRHGGPGSEAAPHVLDGGMLLASRIEPGATAWLTLEPLAAIPPPPKDPADPLALDALEVVVTRRGARDGAGRDHELARWTVPLDDRRPLGTSSPRNAAEGATEIAPSDGILELRGGATIARFDARSGSLVAIDSDGAALSLRGGPSAVAAEAAEPSALLAVRIPSGEERLLARYPGALSEALWRVDADGWLRMRYLLLDDGAATAAGIAFSGLPWRELERVEWLGGGPFRVWGNRLEGGALGPWNLDVRRGTAAPEWLDPVEGARSGVRWARFTLRSGVLIVAPQLSCGDESGTGVPAKSPATLGPPFLWLSRPTFPDDARGARAALPQGLDVTDGFAVLSRIPSIGTKFHAAQQVSPREAARGAGVQRDCVGEIALLWQPAAPASARSGSASGAR